MSQVKFGFYSTYSSSYSSESIFQRTIEKKLIFVTKVAIQKLVCDRHSIGMRGEGRGTRWRVRWPGPRRSPRQRDSIDQTNEVSHLGRHRGVGALLWLQKERKSEVFEKSTRNLFALNILKHLTFLYSCDFSMINWNRWTY